MAGRSASLHPALYAPHDTAHEPALYAVYVHRGSAACGVLGMELGPMRVPCVIVETNRVRVIAAAQVILQLEHDSLGADGVRVYKFLEDAVERWRPGPGVHGEGGIPV